MPFLKRIAKHSSVLLFDDNKNIKSSLRQSITKIIKGAMVFNCSTTKELYSLLESNEFDLIVLDARIEDSNGLDLIRDLKMTHPGTRIIGLYSLANDSYKELILSAGADATLSKFETNARLIKSALKKAMV